MADPISATALIVLAASATAGTAYQVAAGEDQKRKLSATRRGAIERAELQQRAIEAEEAKKTNTANAASYRQMRKARSMYGSKSGGTSGSSDTILGGGTIDANTQPGGTMSGKTQLGA